MKAIVDLSPIEHEVLSNTCRALREKIGNNYRRGELLDDLKITTGYAHYTFSGSISDRLVKLLGREPTSDEIIMIVDNGFSHFGATCTIMKGRFYGRVNTD